jgi:hypothetical protein
MHCPLHPRSIRQDFHCREVACRELDAQDVPVLARPYVHELIRPVWGARLEMRPNPHASARGWLHPGPEASNGMQPHVPPADTLEAACCAAHNERTTLRAVKHASFHTSHHGRHLSP